MRIKKENRSSCSAWMIWSHRTISCGSSTKPIDWSFIYELVEEQYSQDNGRPSMDPVMLIKIPFIQYLYGIKSMRQTVKEIEVNVATVGSSDWICWTRRLIFRPLERTTQDASRTRTCLNRYSPISFRNATNLSW